MTVADARARYFTENGFSLASYTDRWVRVRIAGIPIRFPNVESRRRAIPFHDLHHVATGYRATLRGEAEIGAWEIGACFGDRSVARYWAAWVLNLTAFTWGLALAPRRVYRAFVRGRGCTSLYQIGWSDDVLDLEVDELQRRLGLDRADRDDRRPTWADRAAFAACVAVVGVPGLAAIAALAIVLGR